jgi:hypothetical protein
MRQLFFAVACLVLISCEDILPVENVDLCKGDEPASAECPQCLGATKSAGCPQCRGDAPEQGCPNVAGVSGAGNGGASGQPGMDGGSGSGGSTAGSGGFSGGSGTGSSGTGGTGGTGGSAGASESGTGGASGSGGTGGSDATVPECDEHSDCMNPNPECASNGTCNACSANETCSGRPEGEICDERASSITIGQCIACISHDDCNDPAKPQCNVDGQCGACTGDDACVGHSEGTKCDSAQGSSSQGLCVPCTANSHCTDITKPECTVARTCAACTSDAACTDRPGTTQCNLYDGAANEGHCVRCTGDNEQVCEGNSCKRSTGTCTETPLGTRTPCQECEADSECLTGAKCVQQTFGTTPVGSYCFFADDDALNCASAGSPALRPYSRVTFLTSIDGQGADYCMPTTTCAALHHAAMAAAGGMTCDDNTDCGVANLSDGICLASDRCSYVCTEDYDCPGSGFTRCEGSGINKFCELP